MTNTIVDRLLGCLAELDRQGHRIAAAYVDTAIQELLRESAADQNTSEMD